MYVSICHLLITRLLPVCLSSICASVHPSVCPSLNLICHPSSACLCLLSARQFIFRLSLYLAGNQGCFLPGFPSLGLWPVSLTSPFTLREEGAGPSLRAKGLVLALAFPEQPQARDSGRDEAKVSPWGPGRTACP